MMTNEGRFLSVSLGQLNNQKQEKVSEPELTQLHVEEKNIVTGHLLMEILLFDF